MKTLMLHLNDNIYDEVKAYLSRLPHDKLKIVESETHSPIVTPSFTYKEFEKKWAGFLKSNEVSKEWKEDKIEYLSKKHQ